MTTIDLNCDLGEGFGAWTMADDAALLSVVSSANVACGFHGGDPAIMRRICETAAARGITVGAHVGYRDLAGFGRREIAMPASQLTDDVLYQLAALDGIARVAGTRVRYLKPHGALYNTIVRDADQAAAVVDAVRAYDPTLAILGLPGSEVLRIAAVHGLPTVAEAFGDRAYHADGRLVSRGRPGAVVTDPGTVAARCLQIVTEERVTSIEGELLPVRARSVCVHGDTPGAAELLRRVREVLTEHGVTIAPFA